MTVRALTRASLRRVLPQPVRDRLRGRLPIGRVRLGSLDRLTPIAPDFGFGRGQPIDRCYIESFLGLHAADIHGQVLEVGGDDYTQRFGHGRVSRSDVLHVEPGAPGATVAADLTGADHVSSDTFDCIILTQTLQFVYDLSAAIQTVYRVLAPGGVVLATVPGISQISRYDMDRWGDYWRFTELSVARLFETAFPPQGVATTSFGNVQTAVAFLHGLCIEDIPRRALEVHDPDYQVLIAVRAQKEGGR